METELVHLRDTGGEGNEGADDGKHSANEDSDRAEASEEVIDEIEVAAAEQKIAAIALDHRSASSRAYPVGRNGAEIRGKRGNGGQDDELELGVGERVARKGHDDFRRDRNAGRLNGHEEDDAKIAAAGDGADEKGDDFF